MASRVSVYVPMIPQYLLGEFLHTYAKLGGGGGPEPVCGY